jgi:hypothetical protein
VLSDDEINDSALRADYAAKVAECERYRVALERIALRYDEAIEASTKGSSGLAVELCEIARTACSNG